MRTYQKVIIRVTCCFVLVFALSAVTGSWLQPVSRASTYAQGEEPTPEGEAEEQELPENAACLHCHESPYLQLALPSGEILSMTVDAEQYAASVHGQHGPNGYRCIRCHTDLTEAYPHPDIPLSTARELTIGLSNGCSRCHPAQFDATADSVHNLAMSAEKRDAAVCADCHTGHSVVRLTSEETGELLPEARLDTARMCQQCHSQVYERYAQSVHGAALIGEGNTDTPTCIDCHGIHGIQGPSSGNFRIQSPQVCAKCHADASLMGNYGLSVEVFNTYTADFHGTTVVMFQAVSPDQDVNSPACVDCHGMHDIQPADSPESPVIKANLLGTCQRCHPDANSNFPSAWLSHYQPSFEKTPLVAFVNLAYGILIPVVLGGMVVFVMSDAARRRLNLPVPSVRFRWPHKPEWLNRPARRKGKVEELEAKQLAADPPAPAPDRTGSVPTERLISSDPPEEVL